MLDERNEVEDGGRAGHEDQGQNEDQVQGQNDDQDQAQYERDGEAESIGIDGDNGVAEPQGNEGQPQLFVDVDNEGQTHMLTDVGDEGGDSEEPRQAHRNDEGNEVANAETAESNGMERERALKVSSNLFRCISLTGFLAASVE